MTSDRLIDGRYRLLKQIGKGGMGSIWLAEDTLLRRRVALKQIRTESGADLGELRRRALGEARAMMMVNHPAIVRFHSVFLVDGDPWIDMEYIEGDSLEAIIKTHPDRSLSECAIAVIALPILNGLRVAHEAGVVHRDVKPGNILVTNDKSVFLVDFGIARIDGDAPLTRTGGMIGTPEYMAPERIRAQKVGPPSDLWSFGVTLFYALEGYSPFLRRGEASYQATMFEILYKQPPRLIRQGILADIVPKLLVKDPQGRATSAELAEVLRRILDGPRPSAGLSREPATRKLPSTVPLPPDPGQARQRSSLAAAETSLAGSHLAQVREAVRRASLDAGMAMLLAMPEGSAAKVLAGLRARETGALIQAIAATRPGTAASIIKILSSTGAGQVLDFVDPPAAVSILTALPTHEAARMLNQADPKTGAQILMKLPGDLSVRLLKEMRAGSAAGVLGRVWPERVAAYFRDSDELRQRLLGQLDPAFRHQVLRHLG